MNDARGIWPCGFAGVFDWLHVTLSGALQDVRKAGVEQAVDLWMGEGYCSAVARAHASVPANISSHVIAEAHMPLMAQWRCMHMKVSTMACCMESLVAFASIPGP